MGCRVARTGIRDGSTHDSGNRNRAGDLRADRAIRREDDPVEDEGGARRAGATPGGAGTHAAAAGGGGGVSASASQAPANPERFAEDNRWTIFAIEAVIVIG